MTKYLFLLLLLTLIHGSLLSQDPQPIQENQTYKSGWGMYPSTNKPMLGYRSNMHKKKALDIKLTYTYMAAVPQLFFEINRIKRKEKNEVLNFYRGIGLVLEGFAPGITVPLGFEIKPFKNHPNLVLITEASPKLMISPFGGFFSTLNGNLGLLYFKPANKTKTGQPLLSYP
jgi:hypothetical protein